MVTLEMVREALGAAEPNYQQLANEFGVNAIPYIRQLVESNDERIAIRAVHLGAALGDVWSVKTAASRPSEHVRIAAIGAAPDLKPSDAASVLAQLQVDANWKVNSVAARTLTRFPEIDQIIRSGRPLAPPLTGRTAAPGTIDTPDTPKSPKASGRPKITTPKPSVRKRPKHR